MLFILQNSFKFFFIGENVLHLHLNVEIPQPKIIRLFLDSGVPLLSRNSLNNNITVKSLMNQLNLTSLYEIIGLIFLHFSIF